MMEEAAGNYYNWQRPGFRFYPTEEELLSFYLHHKLHQNDAEIRKQIDGLIPLVDIYGYNPWDLPQLAAGQNCGGGSAAAGEQWFFFGRMQEREARGGRPKRVAGCGYWKATGTLGYVYSCSNGGRCIGEKRSMVFYIGRAPKGRKTDWKFTEYKAYGHHHNITTSLPPPNLTVRHEVSVIRVYKKSKCLRSFDRRPTITGSLIEQPELRDTMTMHTAATNDNDNYQPIGYNVNPTDDQPQPHEQPSFPAATAAAGPRVEYLSSKSSTGGWSSSPPREKDNDHGETIASTTTDAIWAGCMEELDWFHDIIGGDHDQDIPISS